MIGKTHRELPEMLDAFAIFVKKNPKESVINLCNQFFLSIQNKDELKIAEEYFYMFYLIGTDTFVMEFLNPVTKINI